MDTSRGAAFVSALPATAAGVAVACRATSLRGGAVSTTRPSFTGAAVVVVPSPLSPPSRRVAAPSFPSPASPTVVIEAKKGRVQQPLRPAPRGPPPVPEDGTPIFTVLVRSRRSKLWYPVGAVRGDGRAKALVASMRTSWGKKLYQGALNKGMAQAVFSGDGNKFTDQALRQYPQLKKSKADLQFGYKVTAKGVDDWGTQLLTRDMKLPFFEYWKKKFAGELEEQQQEKETRDA
ncbi:hypothetical protein MMPV_000873 [Pyropia vietnamensis]